MSIWMPSGKHLSLFKQKLRSKRYRRQKLESVTAMRQKAVFDVVQEISDDSEIIAQLKEKHLIEREILHCRWKWKDPGIDGLTRYWQSGSFHFYLQWNISLSIGQLSHYRLKTAFYIIAVMIQAFAFYTVCSTALVWTGERFFPDGIQMLISYC